MIHWDSSIERMLADASRIEVSEEELVSVVQETDKLKAADRNIEGFAITIAHMFSGDPVKAGAIMYRLQALARLFYEDALSEWTLKRQQDESITARRSVFAAAAVQPLIEKGGEVAFDLEAFLRKVSQFTRDDDDESLTLINIRN